MQPVQKSPDRARIKQAGISRPNRDPGTGTEGRIGVKSRYRAKSPKSAGRMEQSAAIWTMVRDEDFFLKLWVDYYSRFVPRRQLFILVDGEDSTLPDGLEGCQIVVLPHSEVGPGWDRRRWDFLSHFASALTMRFDVVIGGDVDELIVVDPELETDPVRFILEQTAEPVISPFAVEIVHRTDLEKPLNAALPILGQRRYGRINVAYCKPCIHRVPLKWSTGQHFSDHPDLCLSRSLFLFHLRYVDRDMLLDRQGKRSARIRDEMGKPVPDAAGEGWKKSTDDMDRFLASFVRRGAPEETDFSFEWQRRRFEKSWTFNEEQQNYQHTRLHNRRSYTIPQKFHGLF